MEQACGQDFRVGVKVLKKNNNNHPPPLTSTRIRYMRLAELMSLMLISWQKHSGREDFSQELDFFLLLQLVSKWEVHELPGFA